MSTAVATGRKLMTVEEFEAFVHRPENEERFFDLVRGEVIELSRPRLPHGVVRSNAGFLLQSFARARRKGFVTVNDTGVILERDPGTLRGPDVAYFEGVRSFAELPGKWADFPPRLAVEVLSPNDRADYLTRKIRDYLANGVELVWIVDPEEHSVTVYTPNNGPRTFAENDDLTGGEVLPGFRCKVAEFFVMPEQEATPQPRSRSSRPRRKKSDR